MRKVFRVYDENDDGKLSHANLTKCAQEILPNEAVTSEEIRTMIEMGDYRKRGFVDVEDFIKVMREVGLITQTQ